MTRRTSSSRKRPLPTSLHGLIADDRWWSLATDAEAVAAIESLMPGEPITSASDQKHHTLGSHIPPWAAHGCQNTACGIASRFIARGRADGTVDDGPMERFLVALECDCWARAATLWARIHRGMPLPSGFLAGTASGPYHDVANLSTHVFSHANDHIGDRTRDHFHDPLERPHAAGLIDDRVMAAVLHACTCDSVRNGRTAAAWGRSAGPPHGPTHDERTRWALSSAIHADPTWWSSMPKDWRDESITRGLTWGSHGSSGRHGGDLRTLLAATSGSPMPHGDIGDIVIGVDRWVDDPERHDGSRPPPDGSDAAFTSAAAATAVHRAAIAAAVAACGDDIRSTVADGVVSLVGTRLRIAMEQRGAAREHTAIGIEHAGRTARGFLSAAGCPEAIHRIDACRLVNAVRMEWDAVIARITRDHGVDLRGVMDARVGEHGRTPLLMGLAAMRSGSSGAVACVRKLLVAGASVDRCDARGRGPIRVAVDTTLDDEGYQSHIAAAAAMIATLRTAGADPDAADVAGRTALHVAIVRSAAPVVAALLAAGASPLVADGDGNCALGLFAARKIRESETERVSVMSDLVDHIGAAPPADQVAAVIGRARGDEPWIVRLLAAAGAG